MAQKAAAHLNRPVPNLDMTITRIMNVVWVEPSVKKVDKKTRDVTYTVYNYTNLPRSFRLHAQLPRKANWEVTDLQPSKHIQVSFELKGDMADTFDADDIYFSGLNPAMVMGADMLPGDWGIKGMEITQTDEEDYVEDEEEETTEAEDLDDE